jgi:hypothetical protein
MSIAFPEEVIVSVGKIILNAYIFVLLAALLLGSLIVLHGYRALVASDVLCSHRLRLHRRHYQPLPLEKWQIASDIALPIVPAFCQVSTHRSCA